MKGGHDSVQGRAPPHWAEDALHLWGHGVMRPMTPTPGKPTSPHGFHPSESPNLGNLQHTGGKPSAIILCAC